MGNFFYLRSIIIRRENILDEEMLSGLTVPRLKEECKRNNLPSTGRKHELQERLKQKLFSVPNSVQKQVIFETDENDIALDNNASFDSEKETTEPKQLFDVDDPSPEEETPPETDSKPKSKEYFMNLMSAPSTKKPTKASGSTRPRTAPKTLSNTLAKSPKRKRSDLDDAAKTPGASAKKHRPLGFLSSSPRVTSFSSPPTQAAPTPLGNNNRTPVMFKHT